MQRVEKATIALNKQSADLQKRQRMMNRAMKIGGAAMLGFAAAGGAALYSATRLAARVETLGVVTRQLGKTAGFSATEIGNFEQSIKAQGITMRATRESMALMMQSQIDLAHGTDLARMAQDAAVIANVNSSEAFRRLVFVITSGNVRMARTLGLQLSFQDAYKKTAERLGKTTEELTQLERVQARTNEVMSKGATIAGTYEAAMTTAGKKILSLDRHIEESRRAIGELFTPALATAVDALTVFLKAFQNSTDAQKKGTAAAIATTVAIAGLSGVMLLAIPAVFALKASLAGLSAAAVVATGGAVLLLAALAALVTQAVVYQVKIAAAKKATQDTAEAVVEGKISYEEYTKALIELSEETGVGIIKKEEETNVLRLLRDRYDGVTDAIYIMSRAEFSEAQMAAESEERRIALSNALGEGVKPIDDVAKAAADLAKEEERAARAASGLTLALGGLTAATMAAEGIEALDNALADGNITVEEHARAVFNLATTLGGLDPLAASAQIQMMALITQFDDGTISAGELSSGLKGINDQLTHLNGRQITYTIIEQFERGGGGGGGPGFTVRGGGTSGGAGPVVNVGWQPSEGDIGFSAGGSAHGGPLDPNAITEVGEFGPEFIIGGVVIPADVTSRMKSLGLFSGKGFAHGGTYDAEAARDYEISRTPIVFDKFNYGTGTFSRTTTKESGGGGARSAPAAVARASRQEIAPVVAQQTVVLEQAIAGLSVQIAEQQTAQQQQQQAAVERQTAAQAETNRLLEVLTEVARESATDFGVADAVAEQLQFSEG